MDLRWIFRTWDEMSVSELYESLALRISVFVVEQNCPYHETDGKDEHCIHLMGMNVQGKVLAYLRLVKPGISYDEWSIGRVATDISVRRSGVGRDLMKKGMQYLYQQKDNPAIRISAQLYLEKFYNDLGFDSIGESYLEDDIPHIEMLYTPK